MHLSIGVVRRGRYVDQKVLCWTAVSIADRLDCYAITQPLTGVGIKVYSSDIRTTNRIASAIGDWQIRAKTLKDAACLLPRSS